MRTSSEGWWRRLIGTGLAVVLLMVFVPLVARVVNHFAGTLLSMSLAAAFVEQIQSCRPVIHATFTKP